MAIQFEAFECMMTHSTCYKNTNTMTVKGVLWHSTGANNDMLKRYVQPYEGDKDYDKKLAKLGVNRNKNDWNHITKQAGLNCWIGRFADGTVGMVQTMPWNYRPWGCGTRYKNGPSCNDGWIQFEICEDDLKDKAYAQAVWDVAVNFTAWICQTYNLDPMGIVKKKDYYGKIVDVPVILDHKTSWELGFGSGHGDIRHWFPKILGKDMADARKEVKALLDVDTRVGWYKEDGFWYYYDENRKLITNDWVKYNNKWYYLGPAGAMLTGWHDIDGKKYYLYSPDGHMARHEWMDGFWLDMDGSQTYPHIGEWKTDSKGKWWEDTSGYYPKAKTERIDGVDYTFDTKGYLLEE